MFGKNCLKLFFEKIEYLASIYKSGGLSGKLPKGQYIYIYIYCKDAIRGGP